MKNKIRKVIRFIKIYGIIRTIIKVIGRSRYSLSLPNFRTRRYISIIGCGQFPFSTIAYFLYFNNESHFLGTYDIDEFKSKSLTHFYKFKKAYLKPEDVFLDEKCELIYIASNHSSHSQYAVEALNKNIDVYVEKPISTSIKQFSELLKAKKNASSKLFVGYNRPFSKAIIEISSKIENNNQPISLSCYISGHKLEANHWYRKPEEGTRICGNMGHWIDLTIHLFNKRGRIPSFYKITISYANFSEPDDNLSVSIATDFNDMVNIFLTSRTEPFEGINETINFQCGNVIAKIDDFRSMSIWQGNNIYKRKYFPKDVGHKLAILQPFKEQKRDFNEIKLSTLLMLLIKDMVIAKQNQKTINLFKELGNIQPN